MAKPVVSMLAELETCKDAKVYRNYIWILFPDTFLGSPGDWLNLDILDEEVTKDPAESLLAGADVELRSELL